MARRKVRHVADSEQLRPVFGRFAVIETPGRPLPAMISATYRCPHIEDAPQESSCVAERATCGGPAQASAVSIFRTQMPVQLEMACAWRHDQLRLRAAGAQSSIAIRPLSKPPAQAQACRSRTRPCARAALD